MISELERFSCPSYSGYSCPFRPEIVRTHARRSYSCNEYPVLAQAPGPSANKFQLLSGVCKVYI